MFRLNGDFILVYLKLKERKGKKEGKDESVIVGVAMSGCKYGSAYSSCIGQGGFPRTPPAAELFEGRLSHPPAKERR